MFKKLLHAILPADPYGVIVYTVKGSFRQNVTCIRCIDELSNLNLIHARHIETVGPDKAEMHIAWSDDHVSC